MLIRLLFKDLGVNLQLFLVEGESAAVAESQVGAEWHAASAVCARHALAAAAAAGSRRALIDQEMTLSNELLK